MTGPHLITTRPTATTCLRCRRPILKAYDEGTPVRVDPTPLNGRPAEIATLLAGKWTYTQLPIGWLVYRDHTRIESDNPTLPVYAEHKCPTRPQQLAIDFTGAAA